MRANLEMNASDLDFREAESSTSSSILDTVDSPKAFVVLTRSRPLRLMQPLTTASPSSTFAGMLSPVSAELSRVELPLMTVPSSGILSPGCTMISLPTPTVAGSTFSSLPSFSMLA